MAVGDFSPETMAAIAAASAAAKKKRDALLTNPPSQTAQDEIAAAVAAKRASMTHDPATTERQNVNRFRAQENDRLRLEAETRPLTMFDRAAQFGLSMIPGAYNVAKDPRLSGALVEGATLGARPVAASALDTALGFLTGDGKSFGENLTEEQNTSQMRNRYAPVASMLASMGMGAGVGSLIGKGIQAAAGAVLPRALSYTPFGTAVTQGVGGAVEGYGQATATGEGDPTVAATLGGLGGFAGGFLPMGGAAAKESAKAEAADILFGPQFNTAIGRTSANQINEQELLSILQTLGPKATIADIDPMITASVGAAIRPRTAGSADALMAAASPRVRNADDILSDDLDAAIGNPYGKVARAENKADIIADARLKYDAALTKMNNNGFTVNVADLKDEIRGSFGGSIAEKKARADFLAELDNFTGYRPPTYNKAGKMTDAGNPGKTDLTVKEALNLKKAFDGRITSTAPETAIPKEIRADAIEVKNYLNDQLRADPDFAAAAKIYADEFDIENAQKLAVEVFRGNHSADDFAKMYTKLSAVEKDAVVRAARDEIQTRFLEKTGGAANLIRKLGPTQESAFMQQLDTIFGQGRGDKLYEAAVRYKAFSGTGQAVEDAATTMMKNRVSGTGTGPNVGIIADKFTAISQALQGRATSGAEAGALRRLFLENQKAGTAKIQQALLEYAGKQGPAAEEAVRQLMEILARKTPVGTSGIGGAVGGAVSPLYSANEGPQ